MSDWYERMKGVEEETARYVDAPNRIRRRAAQDDLEVQQFLDDNPMEQSGGEEDEDDPWECNMGGWNPDEEMDTEMQDVGGMAGDGETMEEDMDPKVDSQGGGGLGYLDTGLGASDPADFAAPGTQTVSHLRGPHIKPQHPR